HVHVRPDLAVHHDRVPEEFRHPIRMDCWVNPCSREEEGAGGRRKERFCVGKYGPAPSHIYCRKAFKCV
ncbi:MAG: hypothetical protein OEZ18_04200, partial [Candidatus Bathyarchaeota archaeon]|nr:hypothetical protein [Candidatus Bathyarchaeota archaeon]